MTLQDATDEHVEEPDQPAGPSAAPSSNRGLKLAVIALAGLSVLLGVIAAALSSRDTGDGRAAEVRRAAGAIGSAMLTYDYRHLDDYEKRVKTLATAEFAKEFDASFPAYAELYKVTKGSSKVRDISVFVGEVNDDDAAAMVQVDYLVSGVSGKNRPLSVFFEVTLVHTVNGWRVANLAPVQSNNQPRPSQNPTETSTPGN